MPISEATAPPRAATGCAGSDPHEAAAVRTGWRLVAALERAGVGAAARAVAPETKVWAEHARASTPDLLHWSTSSGAIKIYENDSNRLRFRRTMDYVQPGERVLDIGLGRGYQTGLLLRDTQLSAYHGIDYAAAHVASTRDMLEVNGLTGRDVTLEVGDLYDLTPERAAQIRPDLVICCEVLEHTPDPERALEVLAAALPDGADLLFSLPMYGRLEAVWDHKTIFDASRVKAMAERAGLYVHHVDALANTWTEVLANRDPAPNERIRRLAAAEVELPITPIPHPDYVPVDLADVGPGRWDVRSVCEVATSEGRGVHCEVKGNEAVEPGGERGLGGGQYGGVAFPVEGLHGLRFDLEFVLAEDIKAVYLDGYAGQHRVARWTWTPVSSPATRKTYILRPHHNATFRAGSFGDVATTDTVELFVQVQPGGHAAFVLHRAAFLR